jgi:hypothetical protein
MPNQIGSYEIHRSVQLKSWLSFIASTWLCLPVRCQLVYSCVVPRMFTLQTFRVIFLRTASPNILRKRSEFLGWPSTWPRLKIIQPSLLVFMDCHILGHIEIIVICWLIMIYHLLALDLNPCQLESRPLYHAHSGRPSYHHESLCYMRNGIVT